MNTTNIRNILVVAAALTTVSCEDHFDIGKIEGEPKICLLYTSDAADE